MKTLLRLPSVLSFIWLALAFLSFYALDFYNTEKIANSIFSNCMQQQVYADGKMIEAYCISDRDKILNEWGETQFITPLVFAFVSLGFFWIVGLIFMRNSKWTKNSDIK